MVRFGLIFLICMIAIGCSSDGGVTDSSGSDLLAADEGTDTGGNEDSTPPDSGLVGPGPITIEITAVSADHPAFAQLFSKYINVFGVHIYATANTPDDKVLHAAKVMAEYLDNNEDGIADNPDVVQQLWLVDATLIMANTESEFEQVIEQGFTGEPPAAGQLLFGDETHPNGSSSSAGFDATLEEVLHLITAHGYARVYPNVFGEVSGSTIANLMDVARGGHYEESTLDDCESSGPNSNFATGQCALPPNGQYPPEAWYSYDDPTCSYGCMITEYFYWALTSILGAQDYPGRPQEIGHEWKLYSNELMLSGDPEFYSLLTDPQYKLATQLPDGSYGQP